MQTLRRAGWATGRAGRRGAGSTGSCGRSESRRGAYRASRGRLSTFARLERDAWQSAELSRAYADGFGSLTQQSVPAMLDAVGVAPGEELLDVATGPGYLIPSAISRGATVTGLDFSADMLAIAATLRQRLWPLAADGKYSLESPRLKLVCGNAEELPFRTGSFDVVVCSFGVLHLPHPDRFLLEAHRVLRPGGRLAFTVWEAPPATVGFDVALRSIAEHGVSELDAGPPFFGFADPAVAAAACEAAGLVGAITTSVPQTWHLANSQRLFQVMAGATARTRAVIQAQPADARQAIQRAIQREVEASCRNEKGGFSFSMPAALTSARKVA